MRASRSSRMLPRPYSASFVAPFCSRIGARRTRPNVSEPPASVYAAEPWGITAPLTPCKEHAPQAFPLWYAMSRAYAMEMLLRSGEGLSSDLRNLLIQGLGAAG